MKTIKKYIVSIFVAIISVLMLCTYGYCEELPDFSLDEYDFSLPDSVTDVLDENNITPEKIDADVFDLNNVIDYLYTQTVRYIQSPLKLMLSLLGVILLCGLANVISDTAGGKIKGVFSVVCVLAGSSMITVSVSEVITYGNDTLSSGSVFLSSFIPAFAGLVSMAGKVTSATVFNTLVMTGAQLYVQLASNILMPVSVCVLGLTLSGSVNSDLNLNSLAENVKKIIIWILGIIMTVFVALLSVQSFITSGADSIGLKTARFTVSNAVPFVGSAVSDALSVMQGGLHLIRNNFGVFGIIAGAVLMLPSVLSAFCYKLALSLSAAVSDLFSLKSLSAVIRSAESVVSIIIAMLVCFMLMTVISVSLMIFIAGGAL